MITFCTTPPTHHPSPRGSAESGNAGVAAKVAAGDRCAEALRRRCRRFWFSRILPGLTSTRRCGWGEIDGLTTAGTSPGHRHSRALGGETRPEDVRRFQSPVTATVVQHA